MTFLRKALAAIVAISFAGSAFAAEITAPEYKVDPFWPKPLPNTWTMGVLAGVIADKADNIWIIHRPKTVEGYLAGGAQTPPTAACCIPAPPVLAFNQAGDVVKSWGGKGEGYEWPSSEHGIAVDPKGNIWIGANQTQTGRDNSPADGQILKFTPDGKFLLQIGHAGPSKGSLDTTQLSGVSDVAFDAASNEVFVADGYGNHRIIVFDMDSGKFKRMWGAYGKPPTDEKTPPPKIGDPPATQFRLVHCVKVANDGMVYVCDRDNNRMQVFKKDGTFVAEHFYAKDTRSPSGGTVGHIGLWPDKTQSLLALADIGNFAVRIVRRDNGQEVSVMGRAGPYAGQLHRIHQVTFDSQGNLYTAEMERVQKFVRTGGAKP